MTAPQAHQASSISGLAAGFASPVHDAQRCFKTVMQAMARPGSLQAFQPELKDLPAPLTPMAAALALTLLDYDTPLWLDPGLAKSPAAVSFLKFHTGAPIVTMPVEAAFALVSDPERLINLANFAQGTPDYPDRSTTVILMGQTFASNGPLVLSGPGIETTARFGSAPVSQTFWDQVQANNGQFPRGVDLIMAGENHVAAMPRSTQLTRTEV